MPIENTARADLRHKVKGLLKDIEKLGLERLDKLEQSGAGIVQDHISNSLTYATPKDFIVALADEIKHQYTRPHASNRDRRRIKKYYLNL